MALKDIDELEQDKFYYVVQSAYLKFPETFKKRFGIGTGMKLDDNFPNPKVGVEESKVDDKIQITFEFKMTDLEFWQKNRIKEQQKD